MTQGWGLINLKRTGTGRPNKGTRGGETRDKGNTGLTVTCVILLTFHQNQVHVFSSSQMFFPSLPPHQRQYRHRIYIFMNLQVITYSFLSLGAQFFLLFGQSIIL